MKKLRIFFLLLLMLLPCCLLSGCLSLRQNEQITQQLQQIITALNEDNADQIYQFMYPGLVTREDFDSAYEDIRLTWTKSADYAIKLNTISVQQNFSSSGASQLCQAQYCVFNDELSYTITLTYLSDSNGSGLSQLDLTANTTPVLISGSLMTFMENSPVQWFMLILTILEYIFILLTIIDILRKRPRLFGVWIGAALTFFCFRVLITPKGFQAGGGLLFFPLSFFKIYSDGARNFALAIPAGAVAYWCLRKKLLAKKAASNPINIQ